MLIVKIFKDFASSTMLLLQLNIFRMNARRRRFAYLIGMFTVAMAQLNSFTKMTPYYTSLYIDMMMVAFTLVRSVDPNILVRRTDLATISNSHSTHTKMI